VRELQILLTEVALSSSRRPKLSLSALENIITSQSRVSSNKQREEEEQEGEEAKKER
jgi:predicted nucleic acid-binding protein